MTDVLPTAVPRAVVHDLEARLRDVYDALPHDLTSEIVDGGIQIMTAAGERHGSAAAMILFGLELDPGDTPTIVRRGEVADAEPAVSGWRFAVDELFD